MPDTVALPPKKLGGKDFEDLLLEASVRAKDQLTMSRYGTEVRWINGEQKAVKSLPDFEGVFDTGRQFIWEAKACSDASYSFGDSFHDRQYKHMKKRAPYGVICELVIHFNERVLAKSTVPAVTIAVRVDPTMLLWRDFEAKRVKSINPEVAMANGRILPWTVPPRCQKALPVLF
jgi:penicillin-binding protein-related factor A (putative recombinase)